MVIKIDFLPLLYRSQRREDGYQSQNTFTLGELVPCRRQFTCIGKVVKILFGQSVDRKWLIWELDWLSDWAP